MKNGVKYIVGKEVAGVVVASSPNNPRQQVFLTFTDGTYFEFWGESFNCAAWVDQGGPEAAIAYASKNGGQVKALYGNAGMQPLTLARANQIVDRIQALMEDGEYFKPGALSRVGTSSTAEALAALYLVTAEKFQWAVRNDSPKNRKLFQEYVRAAGVAGMLLVTLIRPDGQSDYPIDVDESVKESETIDSFVNFLRMLDPEADDYWSQVYARIGIAMPMSSSRPNIDLPEKPSWWRRIFG